MITITRTRPSTDIPFYWETLTQDEQDTVIAYGLNNPIAYERETSADGLVKTIKLNVSDAEFRAWDATFNVAFPDRVKARFAHQIQTGITETVEETL